MGNPAEVAVIAGGGVIVAVAGTGLGITTVLEATTGAVSVFAVVWLGITGMQAARTRANTLRKTKPILGRCFIGGAGGHRKEFRILDGWA